MTSIFKKGLNILRHKLQVDVQFKASFVTLTCTKSKILGLSVSRGDSAQFMLPKIEVNGSDQRQSIDFAPNQKPLQVHFMEKNGGPEPKTCTLSLFAQDADGKQPELIAVAEINLGLHFGDSYQTSWAKMKPEGKSYVVGDIDIVFSATLSHSKVAKDVQEFNNYAYWRANLGKPPMIPNKFPTVQKSAIVRPSQIATKAQQPKVVHSPTAAEVEAKAMKEKTDMEILALQKQHALEVAEQKRCIAAYEQTLSELAARKQQMEDKKAAMTIEMELGKETEVIYDQRVSIAELHMQLEQERCRQTKIQDKVTALFAIKQRLDMMPGADADAKLEDLKSKLISEQQELHERSDMIVKMHQHQYDIEYDAY